MNVPLNLTADNITLQEYWGEINIENALQNPPEFEESA